MNNTNNVALEKYETTLASVTVASEAFDRVPLVVHRAALAGPTQRLATDEQVEAHRAEIFGGVIHRAGMTFLESIHEEILLNEPQWKKDLREQELELERIAQEKADNAQLLAMENEDNARVAV
jgi:hypothetical protein